MTNEGVSGASLFAAEDDIELTKQDVQMVKMLGYSNKEIKLLWKVRDELLKEVDDEEARKSNS
jgi:hypothetical protein